MLNRDLKEKDLYNKLMKDYKNLPCDVVSLTVARETVDATFASQKNNSKLSRNDNDKVNEHLYDQKFKA